MHSGSLLEFAFWNFLLLGFPYLLRSLEVLTIYDSLQYSYRYLRQEKVRGAKVDPAVNVSRSNCCWNVSIARIKTGKYFRIANILLVSQKLSKNAFYELETVKLALN
jgi:hypothetical protein